MMSEVPVLGTLLWVWVEAVRACGRGGCFTSSHPGSKGRQETKMCLCFFFCCYCKSIQQKQLKERKSLIGLRLAERSWWAGKAWSEAGSWHSHCIHTPGKQEVKQGCSLKAISWCLTFSIKTLLLEGSTAFPDSTTDWGAHRGHLTFRLQHPMTYFL